MCACNTDDKPPAPRTSATRRLLKVAQASCNLVKQIRRWVWIISLIHGLVHPAPTDQFPPMPRIIYAVHDYGPKIAPLHALVDANDH